MLTPNMSDEELDELVRRSAEAYPEELPLGNWLRMEDKLHEAATEQLVRQRLWRFFGLEVAIVALLLLLWQGYRALDSTAVLSPENVSRTERSTGSQAIAEASPAPSDPTRRSSAPPAAVASASALKAPTEKLAAPSTAATTTTSAVPVPTQASAGKPPRALNGRPAVAVLTPQIRQPARLNQPERLVAASNSNPSSNRRHDNAATTRAVSGGALAALAAAPNQPAATPPALEPLALHMPSLAQSFERLVALPLPFPSAESASSDASALPSDSVARPKPAAARPSYRMVAGIIGAPAWTAVRTLNTAQLGGNLGVTLEYRLTGQLRIRTGLVRSVKRYEAASSDYTPLPAWGWRPGNYEVYANCRVTEIPLDLRYDVVSRPTYSVFAGVGLTSLLMRNERYAYDYQANGQTKTVGAKVVNGSNYAFGLLTLAGGVERAFGSRWSGQVEPFLQLPLGSVGAGKVRLSSTGLSFSLKYGLLR